MRRTLMCLGFLALAPIAQAQQQDVPIFNLPLQFQFSPPGARAVGMGAAFIAIADDATASQSNPAGLVILTKPEISAHLRLSRFDSEFENPFDGTKQTFTEKVTIPSFFSFVYPIKNAAISVYYQQATHFKSAASFSDSGVELIPGFPATVSTSTDVDLLLDQLGLSVAFKLGEKVAIGGSIRTSRLKLDSTDRFTYLDIDNDGLDLSDTVNDSNRQVTFNGGVLFNPNGKVSVGGFWNQGGEYELDRVSTANWSGPFFGQIPDETESNPLTLEVPSYGGGGLAFRPTDRWILAADVVFVNYSVLSPSAEDIADNDSLEEVENGTQFHFGTEYTFLSGQMPISIRAGVYTDPDHDAQRNIDSGQTFFTFGTGFVFGGKFQVDFAAALSGKTKEALISAVYRF